MNDQDDFTEHDEAFHGFEMTDEQVGEGPYQPVAVELKHVFERLSTQAAFTGQAMFLPQQLQDALSEFFWRPTATTLARVLEVSPTLHASIVEITRSISPSLLRQLPDAA